MLNNGSNKIGKILFGNNVIGKVFFGNNLVYQNTIIKKFEPGQSFDVSDISGYENFTIDNFFYLAMSNVSSSSEVVYKGYTEYINIGGTLAKTYDQSNGSFSSFHFLNGDTLSKSNVTPVLVSDTSKLTLMGTKQSFDIKSLYPDTYQDLTADNFIVSASPSSGYTVRTSVNNSGTYWISQTHSLEKSYNASTGVLTCRWKMVTSSNFSYVGDGTRYSDATVYFVPKAL